MGLLPFKVTKNVSSDIEKMSFIQTMINHLKECHSESARLELGIFESTRDGRGANEIKFDPKMLSKYTNNEHYILYITEKDLYFWDIDYLSNESNALVFDSSLCFMKYGKKFRRLYEVKLKELLALGIIDKLEIG